MAGGLSKFASDDLVILRADGVPTYNFGVVVDDLDMNITHVIRGDDHVNNTPRQINIYRALDAALPQFGHLPMILGPDGQKLSKRHGAVSVMQYDDDGFLPEALFNYLARLGWSHGDEEIFSLDDLVAKFSIEAVGRSAGVFNPDKLLWLNAHYIKSGDPHRLAELLIPFLGERGVDTGRGPNLAAVVRTLQERSRTMLEMADGAVFYYRDKIDYDPQAAEKFLKPDVVPLYEAVLDRLGKLDEFSHQGIEVLFKDICGEKGVKMGQIGPPVRVALCGGTTSPSIFEVIEVLGKEETLKRIKRVVEFIKA